MVWGEWESARQHLATLVVLCRHGTNNNIFQFAPVPGGRCPLPGGGPAWPMLPLPVAAAGDVGVNPCKVCTPTGGTKPCPLVFRRKADDTPLRIHIAWLPAKMKREAEELIKRHGGVVAARIGTSVEVIVAPEGDERAAAWAKRQDDDLCAEVVGSLLASTNLRTKWATLGIGEPGLKEGGSPSSCYCRLIELLMHCASNELLKKVNAPLAQNHGATRRHLKGGDKDMKNKNKNKTAKLSRPAGMRSRRKDKSWPTNKKPRSLLRVRGP